MRGRLARPGDRRCDLAGLDELGERSRSAAFSELMNERNFLADEGREHGGGFGLLEGEARRLGGQRLRRVIAPERRRHTGSVENRRNLFNRILPALTLALGTLLSACNEVSAETARVTVVHEAGVATGVFTEGALTVVTVSDADDGVVFQELVVFPGLAIQGEARRYDLLRAVELPAGMLTLRFDVRACTASCPDVTTAQPSDLPAWPEPDVCLLTLDVTPNQDRRFVVVTPGNTASCRIQ